DTPWLGQINKSLRAKPLMGYMTNPDPGVKPKDLFDVREDAYYASGNQLYENIVNNFTAFGYIGLGALLAGAKFINKEMTVAAAWAIHRVAQMGPTEERKQKLIADDKPEQAEYGQHWIVPDPTDLRLLEEQAVAVAMAAARSGVSIYLGANPTTVALEEFEIFVRQEVKYRKKEIAEMRKRAFETALVHYKERFPDRFAPFYLEDDKLPVFYINPVIEPNHFTNLRAQLGVEEKRLAPYMTKKGTMRPKALSYALDKLKAKLKDSALEAWEKKMAYKELVIIKNLALISPALGLALAIRKLQSWEKLDREGRPFDSIFSKYRIKDVIVELVPKATAAIDEFEKELVKYNKGTPPPVPAAPATPTAPAGTGEGAPPVVPPVAGAATLTMASSSSPSASPAITQASGELTAGSGDEIERLVRQKAAGNWQFLYHLSKNPRALKDAISAAGKPGLSPSQVAREAHASLLAKFANRRPTLWGGMPTLSSPLASGRLGKVVTRTLARN
ncbi:MAG: hypothetical protein Q7T11_08830, partial [Deltaproteobacteria bacterium]|nr:hypothetical protein [Deltaproteobacteria bacterium]